jgi:hypothetical protein
MGRLTCFQAWEAATSWAWLISPVVLGTGASADQAESARLDRGRGWRYLARIDFVPLIGGSNHLEKTRGFAL